MNKTDKTILAQLIAARGSGSSNTEIGSMASTLLRQYRDDQLKAAIQEFAKSHDVELTARLVKRLMQGAGVRGFGDKKLVDFFSKPGRTAANKSPDFGRLDELQEEFTPYISCEIKELKKRIEHIKRQAKKRGA